jgi:hypothetical protein
MILNSWAGSSRENAANPHAWPHWRQLARAFHRRSGSKTILGSFQQNSVDIWSAVSLKRVFQLEICLESQPDGDFALRSFSRRSAMSLPSTIITIHEKEIRFPIRLF